MINLVQFGERNLCQSPYFSLQAFGGGGLLDRRSRLVLLGCDLVPLRRAWSPQTAFSALRVYYPDGSPPAWPIMSAAVCCALTSAQQVLDSSWSYPALIFLEASSAATAHRLVARDLLVDGVQRRWRRQRRRRSALKRHLLLRGIGRCPAMVFSALAMLASASFTAPEPSGRAPAAPHRPPPYGIGQRLQPVLAPWPPEDGIALSPQKGSPPPTARAAIFLRVFERQRWQCAYKATSASSEAVFSLFEFAGRRARPLTSRRPARRCR